MSYRSILCHVRAGADNSSVLSVSRTLAKLFEASVIGVAGARLTPPFTEIPVADMMQMEREAAEKALAQAQEEFRAAFRGSATEVAWRSSCDYASVLDFVIHQARAADLVVTSREAGPVLERSDDTRAGPLALQAGRPILVAPGDLEAVQTALLMRALALAAAILLLLRPERSCWPGRIRAKPGGRHPMPCRC